MTKKSAETEVQRDLDPNLLDPLDDEVAATGRVRASLLRDVRRSRLEMVVVK